MPQNDLEQMSLKELRSYVLSHRDDGEALRYYMDRLRADPNVFHYSGGPGELPKLEQLIRERSR